MGEIRRFLSFDMKIFQNWLKFLSCTQNFGVLHLKCKDVTKKLIFSKLFASFVVKKLYERIFGVNEKIFSVKKKYKKNSFLKTYGRNI